MGWISTHQYSYLFFTSVFNKNNNHELPFEFCRYHHFAMKRNDDSTKNRQIKCVAAIVQLKAIFQTHQHFLLVNVRKKKEENFHLHTTYQPWING